ncbi:hypothetical protein EMIHUDRAFT_448232, partial [Emiliania huxleyi CCMP1516]|uniref:Uncharacterized protein n=2 Tax=Emiliania huxleyi TaxID=2903 RepID=A0A0D3IU81_EMIH1
IYTKPSNGRLSPPEGADGERLGRLAVVAVHRLQPYQLERRVVRQPGVPCRLQSGWRPPPRDRQDGAPAGGRCRRAPLVATHLGRRRPPTAHRARRGRPLASRALWAAVVRAGAALAGRGAPAVQLPAVQRAGSVRRPHRVRGPALRPVRWKLPQRLGARRLERVLSRLQPAAAKLASQGHPRAVGGVLPRAGARRQWQDARRGLVSAGAALPAGRRLAPRAPCPPRLANRRRRDGAALRPRLLPGPVPPCAPRHPRERADDACARGDASRQPRSRLLAKVRPRATLRRTPPRRVPLPTLARRLSGLRGRPPDAATHRNLVRLRRARDAPQGGKGPRRAARRDPLLVAAGLLTPRRRERARAWPGV